MAKNDKPEFVTLWTPPGFFSFPYLAEVDNGRQYSDQAYKTDLIVSKDVIKSDARSVALQKAVLKVGQDFHGKAFSLKDDGKFSTPFKDMDQSEKELPERFKNCILIRAKSGPNKKKGTPARQPIFIGPRKGADGKFPLLSKDEIAAIKGGDFGLLSVNIYAYAGSKSVLPGVSLALNAVQFWKKGEGLGQGVGKLIDTAEELDISAEDAGDIGGDAPVENDSML